jgi:hypothetical protein
MEGALNPAPQSSKALLRGFRKRARLPGTRSQRHADESHRSTTVDRTHRVCSDHMHRRPHATVRTDCPAADLPGTLTRLIAAAGLFGTWSRCRISL